MDGDTLVTGRGSPRATRAARDLVPVTAAAGATALFVTIIVGGTTSELHTASLAERTPSVVDPSANPSVDRARDVTVRVTPRAPRSDTALALPADAGTLFDLVRVPPPAAALSVVSAPAGLARLSFPFTPSTAAAVPAASAEAVPAVLPDEVAPLPVEAATPVVPERLPESGRAPKAGKGKTPETATRPTSSTTTATTISLQWSSVGGTSTSESGGDDGDKAKAKAKAKGRPEDPPPDHSQADEHSKANRT